MSNKLKIEVGKFYRTRNGHKVRIDISVCDCCGCVHGAELIGGVWLEDKWLPDGRWDSDYETRPDLVAEWTDEDAKEAK